jgi:uncharacterized protein (TIGR02996 family)
MTYPTNPALEAAIIADAENDLPRLVYADWLDENGDPARAAFIRTQIALHDKNPADPDYPDLLEQRREVFDAMRSRPDREPAMPEGMEFTDVGVDPDDDGFGCGYHRGFPYIAGEPFDMSDEDFDGAVERFRAALPELLANTTIRGFQFWGTFSHRLDRILSAKECGKISALSVTNPRHRPGVGGPVSALVRSPIRASLEWLNLDPDGDADVTTLAQAKFPRLRRWDVPNGFRCTPAAIEKLTAADWFGRLHRLSCPFEMKVRKPLWEAVAAAPHLHTLEVQGSSALAPLLPLRTVRGFKSLGRLRLYLVDATGTNRVALERADFPQLAVFEVAGTVTKDDLPPLAATDWFARLRVLSLASHKLTDTGLPALGRSPVAKTLRILTLGCQNLGPKSLLSLAQDYPALTTLDLSAAGSTRKKVTPKDMARFAAALATSRLRHLNLNWWPLNDTGAIALARNPAMANVTRLNLEFTKVGAKGVRALVESPHLQQLTSLSLSGCPSGARVNALADPAILPNLTFCDLPNRVPKALYARLLKARGWIFLGGPG